MDSVYITDDMKTNGSVYITNINDLQVGDEIRFSLLTDIYCPNDLIMTKKSVMHNTVKSVTKVSDKIISFVMEVQLTTLLRMRTRFYMDDIKVEYIYRKAM